MVERVATEGNMDAFTLADTMGCATPDAVYHVVKRVIQRLKKPVEIHCHQDFGLGVANTVAALAAGAPGARTTITRNGAPARKIPLVDARLALLFAHGVGLGICPPKILDASRLVLEPPQP